MLLFLGVFPDRVRICAGFHLEIVSLFLSLFVCLHRSMILLGISSKDWIFSGGLRVYGVTLGTVIRILGHVMEELLLRNISFY